MRRKLRRANRRAAAGLMRIPSSLDSDVWSGRAVVLMFGVDDEAVAEGTTLCRAIGRARSKEDRLESVAILVTLDCPGRKQTDDGRGDVWIETASQSINQFP